NAVDQSQTAHAARGDLHVRYLAGHADHKREVGEIKIIRRPITGKDQTASMLMHARLVAVAIKRVGITQPKDRRTSIQEEITVKSVSSKWTVKCPRVSPSCTLMRNPTAKSAAQTEDTTKRKTSKRLRSCCCASWRILRSGVVKIVSQSSARIIRANAFQPAIAALANRRRPVETMNTTTPAANHKMRRWRASGRRTRSTIRIYGVELLTFVSGGKLPLKVRRVIRSRFAAPFHGYMFGQSGCLQLAAVL